MAIAPDDCVRSCLSFMVKVADAQAGLFYHVGEDAHPTAYSLHRVRPQIHSEYLRCYSQFDPMLPRYFAAKDIDLVTDEDIVQDRGTATPDFLDDFLKRYGYPHVAEVFLRRGGLIVAGMTLLRENHGTPFTHAQKSLIAEAREFVEYRYVTSTPRQHHDTAGAGQFTPREAEIYRLICKGASNEETAQALGIKLSTVKTHVRSLLAKVGVANRKELFLTRIGGAAGS